MILQRKPAPDELAWVQAQLGTSRCMDASTFDQDLPELLALLSTLDSLSGVSNTNVHLMAALGKGGNILVPSPPEFCWQDAGTASPWFADFQAGRTAQVSAASSAHGLRSRLPTIRALSTFLFRSACRAAGQGLALRRKASSSLCTAG